MVENKLILSFVLGFCVDVPFRVGGAICQWRPACSCTSIRFEWNTIVRFSLHPVSSLNQSISIPMPRLLSLSLCPFCFDASKQVRPRKRVLHFAATDENELLGGLMESNHVRRWAVSRLHIWFRFRVKIKRRVENKRTATK